MKMFAIAALCTVLVGCGNKDQAENNILPTESSDSSSSVLSNPTSTPPREEVAGGTGCYIATPWSDFEADAKADNDKIYKISLDELAFFRAVAVATLGWDHYPVGDSAWLNHHTSDKPGKPPNTWTVAFLDGDQVCSTMKVDAATIKLLTRIYVDGGDDELR
jgi:hypothetical protein